MLEAFYDDLSITVGPTVDTSEALNYLPIIICHSQLVSVFNDQKNDMTHFHTWYNT